MIGQNNPVLAATGMLGAVLVPAGNTTVNTGDFGELYAVGDTTFTTLTSDTMAAVTGTLASGVGTLKAGAHLKGHFTTVTVATGGPLVCYRC